MMMKTVFLLFLTWFKLFFASRLELEPLVVLAVVSTGTGTFRWAVKKWH